MKRKIKHANNQEKKINEKNKLKYECKGGVLNLPKLRCLA
jgi:succinate dehydrogenase flavin-adding protein (antitoxin of CptAB toxin-antitoxin module)